MKVTRRKKRKLGPWELAHRPYTLRVTEEQRRQLEDLRKQMPVQEVLAKGLLGIHRDREALSRVRSEGYAEGFERGRTQGLEEGMTKGLVEGKAQGLEEGKARWYGRIELPCECCGRPVLVSIAPNPDAMAGLGALLGHPRHPQCRSAVTTLADLLNELPPPEIYAPPSANRSSEKQ